VDGWTTEEDNEVMVRRRRWVSVETTCAGLFRDNKVSADVFVSLAAHDA